LDDAMEAEPGVVLQRNFRHVQQRTQRSGSVLCVGICKPLQRRIQICGAIAEWEPRGCLL
jgi:hypothetical protein